MKICKVCGYSASDNISECPNCGSYIFESDSSLHHRIQDKNYEMRLLQYSKNP